MISPVRISLLTITPTKIIGNHVRNETLWRTTRVAVTVLLLASQSEAASNRPPASQGDDYSTSRYRGEVYLLRGFADVFSGGLDQLGADLARAGIPAKVVNHGAWKSVCEKIAANQKKYGRKPVILIGHSLGANSAISMAQQLKKTGVTVTLLVTLAGPRRLRFHRTFEKSRTPISSPEGGVRWCERVRIFEVP